MRSASASEGAPSAAHTDTSPCGKTGLSVSDHVNCGLMAGWENAASYPFPWGQRTDADKVRQADRRASLQGRGRPSTWSTGLQLEKQPLDKGNKIPLWSEALQKASPEPGSGSNFEYSWQRLQSLPRPQSWYRIQSLTLEGMGNRGRKIYTFTGYKLQTTEGGGMTVSIFANLQRNLREMCSGSFPTPNGTNHTI